jgi:undecaprenyl diphosphate synthase
VKREIILPNHLAVIIDGNRRWAKKNNKKFPWAGHEEGAKNLERFLKWCMELNVPQVSVYMLSTENLNRPKREVEELFDLFYEYLKKWEDQNNKDSLLEKYQVRLRCVGDLDKLPLKLRRLIGKLMERTAKYQKRFLNLMVAYGGQFELTEVMKKIAQKAVETGRVEVTAKDVEKNLLVPVPVDLLIRTGGHSRLSNFMPWQSAYAEIYVTKTLWPDFSKDELERAIRWFNSEKRNFGK